VRGDDVQMAEMLRSVLIIAGGLIGLFFASLFATGLGLLVSHAYISMAYTLSVTAIGALFAAVNFRMALRALHSKPHRAEQSHSHISA
jgi:membrane protein implicated in regulation of membrane protease activity